MLNTIINIMWNKILSNNKVVLFYIIILIVLITGLWVGLILIFNSSPSEDAYILFRYAKNLSNGWGIVWNHGGPHSEGATDFLWMISISLVKITTSLNAVYSSYILNLVCLALMMFMLFWLFIQIMNFPLYHFLRTMLFIIMTPILIHICNGFGNSMFVLFTGMVLIFLFLNLYHQKEKKYFSLWAFSMLMCALTRPEGNAFNLFVILTYCYFTITTKNKIPSKFWYSLGFLYILPGFVYFFLRYSYFGLLMPLPFYVKSGSNLGQIILGNISEVGFHILPPLLLLSAILLFSIKDAKDNLLAFCLLPIWLFFIAFLFFVQSQNIVYRYQYPIYFLVLVLSCIKLSFIIAEKRRMSAVIVFSTIMIATIFFTISAKPIPSRADELSTVGKFLKGFNKKGYAVAITEAGQLPYYSCWKTLDDYGLTDPVVAVNHLNYNYWKIFKPQLVVIHYPFSLENIPSDNKPSTNKGRFFEYMRQDNNWEAIAVVKTRSRTGAIKENDYHLYFLSKECLDFEPIRNFVTSMNGVIYSSIPDKLSKFLSTSELMETGQNINPK